MGRNLSMNAVPLAISDSTRQLLQPRLHDGGLIGIDLPAEGVVRLLVDAIDGTKYRIVLANVLEFRADDFRKGNIILDITIVRGTDVQLKDLYSLAHPGQSEQHKDTYLKQLQQRVLQNSLCVFELNPSYGCHIVGLAETISVENVCD